MKYKRPKRVRSGSADKLTTVPIFRVRLILTEDIVMDQLPSVIFRVIRGWFIVLCPSTIDLLACFRLRTAVLFHFLLVSVAQ